MPRLALFSFSEKIAAPPASNGARTLAGLVASFVLAAVLAHGAALPEPVMSMIDNRCSSCHNDEDKKGGLDLTSPALLSLTAEPKNFALWVNVFDRVNSGEMPPKPKPRPTSSELSAFTATLAAALTQIDRARIALEGRASRRRLNRYEYENALRDLLHAPWLQVRDALPEDGGGGDA